MGGCVAQTLAVKAPELIDKMVLTSSTTLMSNRNKSLFEYLQALELAGLESRAQADEQLAAWVTIKAVRDFLLTNLQRAEDGSFSWRINLPVIAEYFSELISWPAIQAQYRGPVLFIKGVNSSYILPEHEQKIQVLFPGAELKTVADAGHWVHSEQAETFQKLVLGFWQKAGAA